MSSELSPGWWKARMTKGQMKKYLREMKEAERLAKLKLQEAELAWDLVDDIDMLDKDLEKKLDNL